MARHRSRRAYLPDPVGEAQLAWLVDSARHASTSSFIQAYTVIAVRDPERKAEVARLCADQRHIHEAPVFLAICADLHKLELACARHGRRLHSDSLEIFVQATVDAALLGQNLQLAAESESLGACMIGAARNHPIELATLLGLPPHVYVAFGMTLGWAADDPVPRERMALGAVLHHERYETEDLEATLDEADQAMRAWARRTNARLADTGAAAVNEQRGWTDRIAHLFGGEHPPKGREHLLEQLRRLRVRVCGSPAEPVRVARVRMHRSPSAVSVLVHALAHTRARHHRPARRVSGCADGPCRCRLRAAEGAGSGGTAGQCAGVRHEHRRRPERPRPRRAIRHALPRGRPRVLLGRFGASALRYDETGNGTLSQSFGDIPAGTPVKTDLELLNVKGYWLYDVIDTGYLRFAPGIAVDVFDVDARVASQTAISVYEEIHITTPVPMLYGQVEGKVGPVSAQVDAGWMSLDLGDVNGTWWDLEGRVSASIVDTFEVFAGYRYIDMATKGVAGGQDFDADIQLQGWFVGGGVRF